MQVDCKPEILAKHRLTAIFLLTLRCLGNALALAILLYPVILAAQTTEEEETDRPLRIDFTPLVGYRTPIIFPTGPNTQLPTPNLVLNAKPSYGMAIGLRSNAEEDLVEFRWARQDTRIHLQGTPAFSNQSVVLNQFLGDFTHEYILNQWPIWARPFVIGSVGATHFEGVTNSFTRFTFGLGGGVKFYFTRHLGVRIQGEWLPLVINPAVSVFCGSGCAVKINATIVSQGEVLVGPMFRF